MSKELYMEGKEVELGSSDGKFDTVYINIKDWNEIQKKLKALEIIKEKRVDISFLFNVCYCSNMGGANLYNEHRKNKELHLTQEDYSLLKEVLL